MQVFRDDLDFPEFQDTRFEGTDSVFLRKKENQFFEIRYNENANEISIRTVYEDTGYKKRPKKSCKMFNFIKE